MKNKIQKLLVGKEIGKQTIKAVQSYKKNDCFDLCTFYRKSYDDQTC